MLHGLHSIVISADSATLNERLTASKIAAIDSAGSMLGVPPPMNTVSNRFHASIWEYNSASLLTAST